MDAMDDSSPLLAEKISAICPNRRTVCPNGRISSQSVDGGRPWWYDGITIKHLLNRCNECKEFGEEFSK